MATRAAGLLLVLLSLDAGGLVVVAQGGPAAGAGSARVTGSWAALTEVDISEHDVTVRAVLLHDFVPGRSLFASSASAFGRDETHHDGLSSIHVGLQETIEVFIC